MGEQMAKYITCPACNYTRRPEDSGIIPEWQCPMCQKAYNKSGMTEPLQQSPALARACPDCIQVSVTGENYLDTVSHIQFDGSQTVDPIAMRARWSPIITNQIGMDHRELVEVSFDRVEFRRTKGQRVGIISAIIFFAMTLIVFIVKRGFTGENGIFAVGFYFLFIVFGFAFLYMTNKLAVFDKAQGCFWKGRKTGGKPPVIYSDKDFASLEDIHALQLIYWNNHTYKGDYVGIVELNLVMNNGGRVNVSAYEYKQGVISIKSYPLEKKPREDATVLGRFLGKPVWDAIDSSRHYWNEERRWLDADPVGKTSADPV